MPPVVAPRCSVSLTEYVADTVAPRWQVVSSCWTKYSRGHGQYARVCLLHYSLSRIAIELTVAEADPQDSSSEAWSPKVRTLSKLRHRRRCRKMPTAPLVRSRHRQLHFHFPIFLSIQINCLALYHNIPSPLVPQYLFHQQLSDTSQCSLFSYHLKQVLLQASK